MTDVSDFKPTSKINNGKNGLANSSGSRSHVKIGGTNLDNQLDVTVFCPAGSTTKLWTGKTYATQFGTQCRARLDYLGSAAAAPGRVGDGDTTVGVTVGNSTPPQPFNVQTGPPLTGSYSVACVGTGGSYKWLAPNGTTGVKLASATDPATSWIFSLIANQQGNCYTIQCQIGGNAYYLKWTNTGPGNTSASLVNAIGTGTAWLLDSDHIEAVASNDPGPPNAPVLTGDTTGGGISMIQLPNPNGSSWTMGVYTLSPARA